MIDDLNVSNAAGPNRPSKSYPTIKSQPVTHHPTPPAGLEHWPDEIWQDYKDAYIRLTTLHVEQRTHLLFACVELLPRETPTIPGYNTPRLKLRGGASARSSLRLLALADALRWYEESLQGSLPIPGCGQERPVSTIRLSPEPRLGELVIARIPTLPLRSCAGLRMHRMVPMEALPSSVSQQLAGQPAEKKLRPWLIEHCFFDLLACPDCIGGLVILADNPVLRAVSHYPLHTSTDGREIMHVRAIPRTGHSLDTIRLRLNELRPDGHSVAADVTLDALGEADVSLPQKACKTSLEVRCTRRGLLSSPPYTPFLRAASFEIRPVRGRIAIEVPARKAGRASSRYEIEMTDQNLVVPVLVGESEVSSAPPRLTLLLNSRSVPTGIPVEEVIFRDDRPFAVSFVRGLAANAINRILFVDPYFSFEDIREFALASKPRTLPIEILTGASANWTEQLKHSGSAASHGELMLADLKKINEFQLNWGLPAVNVSVMSNLVIHDRFLVVDNTVWQFGNSFRSLGTGPISTAVKIRQPSLLFTTLDEVIQKADNFQSYWDKVKNKGS